MQTFSKADIEGYGHVGGGGISIDMQSDGFEFYRKTSLTACRRIEGPFEVETSEGNLTCQDGYLCIDARGYPYPVAADEHELIYEFVDENEVAPLVGKPSAQQLQSVVDKLVDDATNGGTPEARAMASDILLKHSWNR